MKAPNTLKNITRCILCLAALALAGCGGDDNPTAPGGQDQGGPRTIMILSDGGTESHVSTTLTAAGFDVRDGGLFHEFDGSGLDGVDAVVLLTGVDYNNDMNDEGEWALATFVAGGGGLLTTEWLNYSIERSGFHQVLQGILPVTYAGSYSSGSETYTVMVDHPVTAGLPETFMTGPDTEYSVLSPKDGAVQLVRGANSGHAVVTWTQGGRIVSWNIAGEYGDGNPWNADTDRLLVNAVDYVSEPRRGPTVDLNFDTFTFAAWQLTVEFDGDGPAGSSSPGDFFITVRLETEVGGETLELGRQDRVLVQATDGDIELLNIDVQGRVPRVDGQTVVARISYYENDTDGPQQSVGEGMVYIYSEAEGCWDRTFSDSCVGAGDSAEFGDLYLQDFTGDPLEAELRWRLEVD